ncbi:MAG: hypothetical protein RIT17_384, partial [Pseudomonadota bacterium]
MSRPSLLARLRTTTQRSLFSAGSSDAGRLLEPGAEPEPLTPPSEVR